MKRIISAVISVSALIFVVFLLREEAVAQTAKDLVGASTAHDGRVFLCRDIAPVLPVMIRS